MISYLEKWLDNKLEGYSNSITMNRFIKKNEIDNYLNLFKKIMKYVFMDIIVLDILSHVNMFGSSYNMFSCTL